MDAPRSLTVFARLEDGKLEHARAAARAWEDEPESPFARLPAVHLGRIVVVEKIERHIRKAFEHGSFLLLSIDYDGELDALFEAMARKIPAQLDALLGACEGWPGATDAAAVSRWIGDRRVQPGVELIAYPNATVERVLAAIDVHRRVVRFACETQDLAPAALQAAFREAFPEHAR